MNATATVHIGVDPIGFSAPLASIGAHYDGSRSYTAGVGSAVELQQTEDFIGLGGHWTYETWLFDFEIGSDANITNIRCDTLSQCLSSFGAQLNARHRDSGQTLQDSACFSVHRTQPTSSSPSRAGGMSSYPG